MGRKIESDPKVRVLFSIRRSRHQTMQHLEIDPQKSLNDAIDLKMKEEKMKQYFGMFSGNDEVTIDINVQNWNAHHPDDPITKSDVFEWARKLKIKEFCLPLSDMLYH